MTSLGSFLPVLLAPSAPHPQFAPATLGHLALCPLGLDSAPYQLRLGTWSKSSAFCWLFPHLYNRDENPAAGF